MMDLSLTTWIVKSSGRFFLLTAATLAVLILSYCFFVLNRDRAHHTVGWETEESAGQPFKPGVILNGQPPPDYEISLVEPEPNSPVAVNPGDPCDLVVNIRMLDAESPNSEVPPTFVFAIMNKGKKVLRRSLLQPSAMDHRSFTYSGRIYAPEVIGVYETSLMVEYAVVDVSSGRPSASANKVDVEGIDGHGKSVSNQRFLKGPTFYVTR